MAKARSKSARKSLMEPIILNVSRCEHKLPKITFHSSASLDGTSSDTELVVIPKLLRMAIHRSLRPKNKTIAILFDTRLSEGNFSGKLGETLRVEIPGDETAAKGKKKEALFVGIGPPRKYSGQVACRTFKTIIEEAIRLGVKRIAIPFVPHPGTGGSGLGQRNTAFKLRHMLDQIYHSLSEQPALEEIQICCSPQARVPIREGLMIESSSGDEGCRCTQEDTSEGGK